MDSVGYTTDDETDIPFTNQVTGKDFSLIGSIVTRNSENAKIGSHVGCFSNIPNKRINIYDTKLNLGTSDFTISFWLNPDKETDNMEYSSPFSTEDNRNGTLCFFIKDCSTKTIVFISGVNKMQYIISTDYEYIVNTWTHYALVRKNGIFYFYENGIKIAENASLSNFFIDLSNFSIGGNNAGEQNFYRVYMDDFVIYNKTIYDGNFTPPDNPAN